MRKAYDDHVEAPQSILDANWRMLLDLSRDCEFFAGYTWDDEHQPDASEEKDVTALAGTTRVRRYGKQ